ncbi:hypothetical protein [Paenibacillus crassostreae]|nr:hypothetical protein [Paenibacillus crassostreae]
MLSIAGYKNVTLYIGSWSDWISYEDNPITMGEKNKNREIVLDAGWEQ